jgi:hypothetical protein
MKFIKIKDCYSQKHPLINQDRKWYWSGDVSNEDYAKGMSNDASNNEIVRAILRDMLMLKGAAKKSYRDEVLERYKDNPLKLDIEKGMKKCFELMKLEVADLDLKVKAFENKVNAN